MRLFEVPGERRFPLVELRPQPAVEPREVLVQLLHAFRVAYRFIEDKKLLWQAGECRSGVFL